MLTDTTEAETGTATTADLLAAANARWVDKEVSKQTPLGETADAETAPETTLEQETPETTGAETSGTEPTEPTTGRKPEGLSPQLLQSAIDAKIPIGLARLVRDNEALAELIETYGDSQGDEVEAETEGQRLAKGLLAASVIPEDELDDSDPRDRQIRELLTSNKKMSEALGKTFDTAKKVEDLRKKEGEVREHQERVTQLDSGIDALGHGDFFGPSESPNRVKVWKLFNALLLTEPEADRAELVQRAAYASFPKLVSARAAQEQAAALTKQNGQKLGAGPAKAPAPKQTTAREELLKVLNRANSNSVTKRGY